MTGGADEPHPSTRRGVLAWFVSNPVAANVLMLVVVFGGLMALLGGKVRQEVFPEVSLDMVVVQVPYPGASPEEVEQGVLLALEEAVRGLDGVKQVRSTAREGMGVVSIELLLGTDPDRALSDVKSAVDRITSFPEEIERPVVALAVNRRHVISLVVHGPREEGELKAFAERVRDDLLQSEHITQVELSAVRPPEISVEVPLDELRRYGLTLPRVAERIRAASVELPAGEIRTEGGKILVRTSERKDWASEFASIPLLTLPDGTVVRLGEVARVRESFAETDQRAFFDGEPAVMVDVYRVGEQSPLEISKVVHDYIETHAAALPEGLSMDVWSDASVIYRERIELLLRNAYLGLVLVLLTLGLFLEMRLAFWVTLGIPISFLGGLMLMPSADVTLNMISLFAFILTLGMVVDDAIVVGEAVYHHRQRGERRLRAAVAGVQEVAVPVVFAVLTTCVAFAPMLFVPGWAGKLFRVIPVVVILVLLVSLLEALFVLPAHLAHGGAPKPGGLEGWVHHHQQRFSRAVERFVQRVYRPQLEWVVRRRYLTLAIGVGILIGSVGLVAGGRVKFTFMPNIESDVVVASIELPVGTSPRRTERVMHRLEASLREALQELGEGRADAQGILSELGRAGGVGRGPHAGVSQQGGHLARVMVYLVEADRRPFTASALAERWRERFGDVAGVESLTFDASTATGNGSPIAIRLAHRDTHVLERAAAELAEALHAYEGVVDIDDGFRGGKRQVDVHLTEEGRAAGLNALELARQVRGAFWGMEAARQQRGRDELKVYVRLPERDRRTLHTLDSMVLRTPSGAEMPLEQAAELRWGRAPTVIKRTDGRRTTEVTADIVPGRANANEVMADVQAHVLPELVRRHPGLSWAEAGQQHDQSEIMGNLRAGFGFALVVMFCMLAIVFRSYLQPLIVMSAIPFGLVGAIAGHVALGYDLSIMSMMGVVALSGVVVNDSLVLVDAINGLRRAGASLAEAVVQGGVRRFRPILLTSVTTFFGLAPMLSETSLQARFLIPMAISLAFGVLFATGITLMLVPAFYVVLEDVIGFWRRVRGGESAGRVEGRREGTGLAGPVRTL